MTRKTLGIELNKTAAVFRTELSTLAVDGYWESLRDYSDDDFAWACKHARETCGFMPTIRDLLAMLRPRRQMSASREETNEYVRQLEAWTPKEPWPNDRRGQ